jgi:alpha/beta superfamily hydrolase
MHKTIALLLLSWMVTAGAQPAAPDREREERWAREVAPQVVVGDVMWLATPAHAKVLALYTAAEGARVGGAVIAHGAGVHPDFGLIGALRAALPERGITTLSVQMPVLAAGVSRDAYVGLYRNAGERLDAAIAALRAQGIANIAIVTHSLGAAMADAWLARAETPPIAAWVPVGMLVDFARAPREPVLDIVAQRDFPEAFSSAKLRQPRLPRDACSRAIVIADTDHYFENAAAPLAKAAGDFLVEAFAGRCSAPQ